MVLGQGSAAPALLLQMEDKWSLGRDGPKKKARACLCVHLLFVYQRQWVGDVFQRAVLKKILLRDCCFWIRFSTRTRQRTKHSNTFFLCFPAERLARIPGVSSLHEVHVWELAGGKNIATLHVKCQTPTDYQDAAYKIRKVFHEAGIHSVTIQPEYIDHKTSNLLCSSPCISKACDSQLCCSQQEAPLAKTNGYTEKNDSCLSAQHKDNGSSKSDVEIRIDSPLTENGVKDMKNGEVSDDKSQLSSTRF